MAAGPRVRTGRQPNTKVLWPRCEDQRIVMRVFDRDRHAGRTLLRKKTGDGQTLAAGARDLKLVIDTTPALIWSALPTGELESVNQHYLDFAGVAWKKLRGWGWTGIVHPGDLDQLTEIWKSILAAGVPGEAEARARRNDGEY